MLQSRVMYSIIFYILMMVLIITLKPKIMFTKEGHIKQFGVNKYETIYSLGVFCVVSAILTFYIFCLIDFVFSK